MPVYEDCWYLFVSSLVYSAFALVFKQCHLQFQCLRNMNETEVEVGDAERGREYVRPKGKWTDGGQYVLVHSRHVPAHSPSRVARI
jgi:hypothetical protein